jgi:Leucine-rich repeat (LRR) protein
MEPNQDRSLILRPSHELTAPLISRNRILGEMVEETLAIGREETMAQTARFRIGEYTWREPDYRQILLWAKVMNFPPAQVIRRLLYPNEAGTFPGWAETTFADGQLLKLNWNFSLLPIQSFEWVDKLALTHLAFWPLPGGKTGPALNLRLPNLTHLSCMHVSYERIDLSGVPMLEELSCIVGILIELDLSPVPMLRTLDCSWNQLTELDLSPVPMLTCLSCGGKTNVTRLDLSCVPMLTALYCEGMPGLKELDLSCMPLLKSLSCGWPSYLPHLDISSVPKLEELDCYCIGLMDLDLSNVPMLTKLSCPDNALRKLDVSALSRLRELSCSKNSLSQLDLSSLPMLEVLDCGDNELTTLDIRPLAHLKSLKYDVGKTRLIQRSDQNF